MSAIINAAHPFDVSQNSRSLDLTAVELPQSIHGDCAGTAGTAGTLGSFGGCAGSVGTFGSYGCGGGAADLGSMS